MEWKASEINTERGGYRHWVSSKGKKKYEIFVIKRLFRTRVGKKEKSAKFYDVVGLCNNLRVQYAKSKTLKGAERKATAMKNKIGGN